MFEHHEGAPPIAKSDEKPPMGMENGDIVLTNMVSKIFSPFLAAVSVWFIVLDVGQRGGNWEDGELEGLQFLLLAWLVASGTYNLLDWG